MNKSSWIYRFLSYMKVFFSAPPPEEDESHAATRYHEAYKQAKFDETCKKEAEK